MARILVVDDDPLGRAMLVDLVRGLGHDVAAVDSGTGAVRALDDDPYAFVVSEVSSPGIDGFALAAHVARRPVPPAVVLVSANYAGDAAREAEARGASVAAFLTKPVDARRLAAVFTPATARPVLEALDWSGASFLDRVRGTAETFPPLRVLFLAHRVDASGALVVERTGGTARVVVRSGRVMHIEGVPGLLRSLDARLPDTQNLPLDLGAAVAAGHAVDKVLEAAASGLGEWLAAGGGGGAGARVQFDPRFSAPAGAFALPTPIPRIITIGLRSGRSAAEVERHWGARGAARASAHVPDDSPEARWGLDATALRVLRVCPSSLNVDHLITSAAGADQARRGEVLRSIDLLFALGLIKLDGGSLEVESPRAVTGPRVSETEEDPRVSRLRSALAAMEGAHPVDVLELGDRKVLTELEVTQGYRITSRRYHPDTYFNAPPVVRAMAEACFSRINGAYESLRAPGGLADAQRFLAARAGGRGFVTERDHQAARVAYKRAEVLFRNRDWKGADALFQEAVRLDSTTWPHAFAAIRAGALSRRLSADEAVRQLDELAVPDPPRRADVLVAVGNILKMEGRPAEALKRYKQAMEADPENRDAQRELRLHQGRAEPAKATSSTASALSGLFRRSTDKS